METHGTKEIPRAAADATLRSSPLRSTRRSTSREALEKFLLHAGLERSEGGWLYLPDNYHTGEVDEAAGTMVVTISTRARDRVGDILDPAGCRLESYRKNPVVLWAHDSSERPIAKSLWTKTAEDRVIAKPKFHRRTELSREVFALFSLGYLSAWSVAFIPEQFERIEGEEGARDGWTVLSWDLLEYSAVPVPANPEALSRALKKMRITAPALCRAFELPEPDLVVHEITIRDGAEATADGVQEEMTAEPARSEAQDAPAPGSKEETREEDPQPEESGDEEKTASDDTGSNERAEPSAGAKENDDEGSSEIETPDGGEVPAAERGEDSRHEKQRAGEKVTVLEVSAEELAECVRSAVGGEIRRILGRID